MSFLAPLRAGARAVSFRPEQPADREFLYRVYASAREEELAPTGWTPEQKEQFLRMQFHAQDKFYRDNYPGHKFLVIALDGVDAGRLYLHEVDGEIRVMDIALLSSFRRMGAGGAIMQSILDEAARRRAVVTLHVENFNPAMRLYTRLGFVKLEDGQVYARMQWRPPAG
jgi:ribosomal protein S18 acetylase RimI-like enzyme